MGCFSKAGLFILNFAIFAAGVAVVVLASMIIHENNYYGEVLVEGGVFTVPIIILIAGLVIVILGFLGCCGAMKESSCMLKTYAFVVSLLLIAEVTLGILILVFPAETESYIKKGMMNAFEDYGSKDDALDKTVDSIQHDLHCCGVNSWEDWRNITWGQSTASVSKGCCKEMKDDCGKGVLNMDPEDAGEIIYTQGCYDALKEDLQAEVIALGVILFIMAIIQVAAISCACGLSRKASHYA